MEHTLFLKLTGEKELPEFVLKTSRTNSAKVIARLPIKGLLVLMSRSNWSLLKYKTSGYSAI
jgi:hypothetical protein